MRQTSEGIDRGKKWKSFCNTNFNPENAVVVFGRRENFNLKSNVKLKVIIIVEYHNIIGF
jgi:hypothetical protein